MEKSGWRAITGVDSKSAKVDLDIPPRPNERYEGRATVSFDVEMAFDLESGACRAYELYLGQGEVEIFTAETGREALVTLRR